MRPATLLALQLVATAVRADLPSPRLDRIFPLGAAAGSAVEVEIAGADLEDAKRLLFDHPGITATHLKDRTFRVAVAKDVPPGTYDARVVGKYGLSSPRLFAVSAGLTEVVKKKGIDTAETAQPVAVNSVVNGTVDGSRDDFFRFPAKKGQRIVVECQAQALDSQLAPVLEVTAGGAPVGANGGYFGRDPLVDFVVPKDSGYLAAVHDLSQGKSHAIPLQPPAPVKVSQVTAPEGKADGVVAFEVQANAKPCERTVAVQGQGQGRSRRTGRRPG